MKKLAETTEKHTFSNSCYDWVGAAVVALVAVAVLFTMFFRVVNVSGDSMNQTLVNGEKLLLSNADTTLEYGDIVVIRRDGATPLIKRVIGLPGDQIYINDSMGKVFRNGEPLQESYAFGYTIDRNHDSAVLVGEGEVYVLGDNREDSHDSRIDGCYSMEDVVGVVTHRLSPFESLKSEG